MSLKDQLLKAGLVSKKKARESDRRARSMRRKQQSQREKKSVVAAREAAQRKAEAARLRAEKRAAREARERAREVVELQRRVGQILTSHRIHHRSGQQLFWIPSPDGRHLLKLHLPGSVADDLHRGRLAASWIGPADAPEIVLIPRAIAERVAALEPARILFHNPARPEDPAEMLYTTGSPSAAL